MTSPKRAASPTLGHEGAPTVDVEVVSWVTSHLLEPAVQTA